MTKHKINLSRMWQVADTFDCSNCDLSDLQKFSQAVVAVRSFNRPTGLDASNCVNLEFDQISESTEIEFNGSMLVANKHQPNCFEITKFLRERNQIRIQWDGAGIVPGALYLVINQPH